MRDFSIITNIYTHPLNRRQEIKALFRFIKWQFGTRLFPFPVIYPFVENSVLVVERGMTGATGNIYNGLHEYKEMLFTLHFLRPGDVFVDVGANIGSYTVLASANCGARSIALEPVPSTFKRLKRNVVVNNIEERVILLNNACGSQPKDLSFTASLDAGNHVVRNGENLDPSEKVIVRSVTLDSSVEGADLIKIDVEGFETEVIEGGVKTLSSMKLNAIIIELNGMGSRYGFSDEHIHQRLINFGFRPYTYDPFNRTLLSLQHLGSHNTIYIRDLEFVMQRIKSARRFKVNNLSL